MKILVVAHYQGEGSPSAIFIHAQIRAYLALGHQVRVLTPIPIGKRGWDGKQFGGLLRREEIDGASYFFLRFLSLSRYGNGWFNLASASFFLKRCWSRLLGDFRPDIIHAHTLGFDSELGALLKKHLHAPLVVTTHGSDTSIPVEQGKTALLKPLADQADQVIAVSSALAGKLHTCGTKTPVSVILNGYACENLADHVERIPLSMIQVCHLQEQKRVHTTIRAFAAIRNQYPQATLTIIGQGPQREELEALCKELGLGASVRFLGQRPNADVLAAMAGSRFFCMPSVREGFGIVYLEAMASGCITIGTEGEGIADFIKDGENGFLVPPDDPDAITRVVEWCHRHPDRAEAIAQQGRRDAQGLTWEKNALEYQALFTTFLKGT